MRRIDGTLGWTHSRAVPLLDEQGAISSWFGAASDVTARHETEEALKREHQRKDEFLATLGHELRNPLAPLRTTTDLLKRRLIQDPELRELSQIQERQLGCLTRMVDNLLDMARIKSGRIELQCEPLDLREAVAGALENARPAIEVAGQVLTIDQAEVVLPVYGDRVRLIQAVTNLLHNANKYTPNGGQIDVVTRLADGQLEVRVRDSGIGLAPELIDRIFDLFAQGPQRSGAAKSGLGLGLTLVRRIMELHEGSAEARSDGAGKGSELILRLPCSTAAAAALAESESEAASEPAPEPASASGRGPAESEGAADEPASAGGPASVGDSGSSTTDDDSVGAGRRILVVDDNPDIVASLTMALKSVGHRVEAAHSGREALTVAARFDPHAVVLDIGLPDMEGHAVARSLREQPQTAQAVLIAVTGYGQASDREQAHAAGFDHHLPKPARLKDLLAVLDKRRD